MKKRPIILLFASVLICFLTCKRKLSEGPIVKGFVPNGETAIKIADAVLLPIYGKEIYDEKPFSATLNIDGNWLIIGETHGRHGGGELMVVLQPKDGKIIFAGRDPGK